MGNELLSVVNSNELPYNEPSTIAWSQQASLLYRDVNETRETRENFSVSSIEFLAVEKCDKQLFNDGQYANPPAGRLRVGWESVTE